MKAETTTKIEQYRSELPKKREKIFAAAMMLAIAIITAASATYAWITLSASPEVTSIDTTVAANGSLEIALASGTGAAPGKSAAGDSAGADSNVVRANTTWGNLVNLSDPSYGLSSVTLRPAMLSESNLLSAPLKGVSYGEDGRVSGRTVGDDFGFAYFDGKETFLIDTGNKHLGIRAISSVTEENVGNKNAFKELLKAAQTAQTNAVQSYNNVTTNETYIDAIEGILELFAGARVNGSNIDTVDVSDYVPGLYAMMLDYQKNVMDVTAKCYVQMANLLVLLETNEVGTYKAEKLISAAQAKTLPPYITGTVKSLSSFAEDYTKLAGYMKTGTVEDFSDLSAVEREKSLAYWSYQAEQGKAVYWSSISEMVNFLCDIDNATLNGTPMNTLDTNTAIALLSGENANNMSAVLTKGASLCKTEQRLGGKMSTPLQVTVTRKQALSGSTGETVDIPLTLKATLSTAAEEPFEIPEEIEAIKKQKPDTFAGGTKVAQDTYALAVDLWVRTNAGAAATAAATVEKAEDGTTTTTTEPVRAYLTLEGKVRYGTETKPRTETVDGTTYYAFTVTTGTGEDAGETVVYSKNANENGTGTEWYSYNEETEKMVAVDVTSAAYTGTKTALMDVNTIVEGYDGVNRVWSSKDLETYEVEGATSTTQGGGSCYIFYADSEEQQSRFLELLGAMRVAFINSEGKLIGTAAMDTKNYYAENGKVTVPLTLDTGKAVNLGKDDDGNTVYGLMALTKNAATRITAIVYLDGTKLTNQMVLANGDIQGNLNIQFGSYTASKVITVNADGTKTTTYTHDSTQDNDPIENEKVMSETVKVTAALEGSTEVKFDPDEPAAATVKVTIEGKEPKTVGVRFIRAISATQGVQQEMATLTGSGKEWSGSVTFDTAGKFVLRSVWIDGTEYALSEALTFTVRGASVKSATVDAVSGSYAEIMQSGSTFRTNVTVGFAESDQTLKRVTGIFMDENGRQVNAPLTLVSGTGDWKGTAVFSTSGTYTLKYVEIDGQQSEISENLQRTLKLQLGISTEVKISASTETQAALKEIYEDATPTSFAYSANELGEGGVTLTTSVKLYDNRGTELTGLTGVKLYYGRSGSVLNGLDTDLTWDSRSGSYTGEFKVTGAGVFSFSKVTVALSGVDSTITSAKSAPDIRSMSMGEMVTYHSNETKAYQFVPNGNGCFEISMSNSGSASGAEAEITNGTRTLTAAGEMGTTSGTETSWSFAIPEDGNWQLNSVTMYGVFYKNVYYGEDNGLKLNLEDKNITAKVVKNLYVTVSGESESFTGDVMAEHAAAPMTVTVVDFEGKPYGADGEGVSDLEMNYTLNVAATSQNLSECGIESVTASDEVAVKGDVTQDSADKSQYTVNMNFTMAGLYDKCSVGFKANGTTFIAGTTAGAVLKFVGSTGKQLDACPTKTVEWNTPDAQVYEVQQPYVTTKTGTELAWKTFDSAEINNTTSFTTAVGTKTDTLSVSSYSVSGLWLQASKKSGSSYYYYPGMKIKLVENVCLENMSSRDYGVEYSVDMTLSKWDSTYGPDYANTHVKTFLFGTDGVSYNTCSETNGETDSGLMYLGFHTGQKPLKSDSVTRHNKSSKQMSVNENEGINSDGSYDTKSSCDNGCSVLQTYVSQTQHARYMGSKDGTAIEIDALKVKVGTTEYRVKLKNPISVGYSTVFSSGSGYKAYSQPTTW